MRIEIAGAVHHVTANAVTGQDLFRDDRDRRIYLSRLSAEIRRCGWRLLTYCLMDTHVHLLIETPRANLGAGFEVAHNSYARYFNERHGGRGHVFHRRFKNKVVRSERHLVGCLRYIARNPVEAGMCDAPGDFPWSAHNALAGAVAAPDFLDADRALSWFGVAPAEARPLYTALAGEADGALMQRLRREDERGYVRKAKHDFLLPAAEIAGALGMSLSSVYRLAAASPPDEA